MSNMADNDKESNDSNSTESNRWCPENIRTFADKKQKELETLLKAYNKSLQHIRQAGEDLEPSLSKADNYTSGGYGPGRSDVSQERVELKQAVVNMFVLEEARNQRLDKLRVDTEAIVLKFKELNKQAKAGREKYDHQVAALERAIKHVEKAEGIVNPTSTPKRQSKR